MACYCDPAHPHVCATPGPWILSRDEMTDKESLGAAFDLVSEDGIPVGYFISLDGKYDPEAEVCETTPRALADARLIAAAPEMLAALRAVVDGVDGAYSNASALLAKLEGK